MTKCYVWPSAMCGQVHNAEIIHILCLLIISSGNICCLNMSDARKTDFYFAVLRVSLTFRNDFQKIAIF